MTGPRVDVDLPTFASSEPLYLAAVEMVQRCGATEYQIRYQDDEEPTVWIAVATHNVTAAGMMAPASTPGTKHWVTAAALNPVTATTRLVEELMAGGTCVHCGRSTRLSIEPRVGAGKTEDNLFCWYVYDDVASTFQRGCEP